MLYCCYRGAGCLPVSLRSVTMARALLSITMTITVYAPPHRGIHHRINFNCSGKKFNPPLKVSLSKIYRVLREL